MLERFLRKIILLFYKEWNISTVQSFLLVFLMFCLFTINILLGINYIIALCISSFLYIALVATKNFNIKEDKIIENKKIKDNKSLNLTFFVYCILVLIDIWVSSQLPLLIFNSKYTIWWFIFYTTPVFILCCFSTYYIIKSIKNEINE